MSEKIDARESAGEHVTTPSKSTERNLSASAMVRSSAVWAPVLTIRCLSASLCVVSGLETYDDIDRLVDIDDPTARIDDRYGTNPTFREHVNDIENSRIQRGSCKRVESISIRPLMLRVHVRSNTSILNTPREVLGDISALLSTSFYTGEDRHTLVAINLSTRY